MSNNELEILITARNKAKKELDKVGKQIKTMDSNTRKYAKATNAGNQQMQRSWAKIAVAIGAVVIVTRQLTKAINSTVMAAAKMEGFQVQLTTVLGSLSRAKEMMAWITQFAMGTPFQVPELVEASAILESVGLKAKKNLVILGNTAAAMGKDLMNTVQAIISMETEVLRRYGVMVDRTGKKAVISWADSEGKKKEITIKNNVAIIRETLLGIWNDRYQGGMDRYSKSYLGMVSNLEDAIFNFQVAVGDRLLPVMKKVTLELTEWISKAEQFTKQDLDVYMNDFKKAIEKTYPELRILKTVIDDLITVLPDLDVNFGKVTTILYLMSGITGGTSAKIAGLVEEMQKLKEARDSFTFGGGEAGKPSGATGTWGDVDETTAKGEEISAAMLSQTQKTSDSLIALWNTYDAQKNALTLTELANVMSAEASKIQVILDTAKLDEKVQIELAKKKEKLLKAETKLRKDAFTEQMKYTMNATASVAGSIATVLEVAQGESKKYAGVIKALRIGETIINTASSIMLAWATVPPPANIAAAAAAAAAGAAQIAVISAQPMAQGGQGIVTKPTLFLAGEAGAEAFSFNPLSKGGGSGGNIYVEINNPSIRSDEDIDTLVEEISRQLSYESDRIR